jgi:hypothetical protein
MMVSKNDEIGQTMKPYFNGRNKENIKYVSGELQLLDL